MPRVAALTACALSCALSLASLGVSGPRCAAAAEPAKTRGFGKLKALRAKQAMAPKKLYGRSVALVVGIDGYRHLPKLGGAERDARRMAELFGSRGFEVRMLLGKQATRTAILEALEGIVAMKLAPKDRLLIYFAGHGISRKQSGGAMGFLMPVEGHPDKPISQGIEMAWLQRVVATEIRARHVMFVADACYSGLAIGHRGAPKSAKVPGYVRMIANGRMRAALVAGTSGQQAHEFRGHGLFTYYLLQGLRGAADTQKPYGVVTSQELASYVRGHVSEQAATHGWQQTPQYRGEGEGEFLFFVGGKGRPPKGLTFTVSTGAAPAPAGRSSLRWAFGSVAVVGAVAAGSLAALAISARGRYDRFEQADGRFLLPESYTDAAFLADVETFGRRRTAAWIAGGVGLAAATAWGLTWLLDGRAVALAPAPRGLQLRVGW